MDKKDIAASGRRLLDDADIAVSIVSYGTSRLVLEALPALLAELGHCRRAHVAIVDNASPDGDGAKMAEGLAAFADAPVELVLSDANGGFAAGNNLAFAAIRKLDWAPEAILLLNPDAEMRPGALAEMLRVMRATPRAGFVGPRLEHPEGGSWVAAFYFPSMLREFCGNVCVRFLDRKYPALLQDATEPTRADWITGTASLIRREAWDALGDMDDGYFLYYEEVDYMLQAARLGWECWHAPAALILHDAGAATGVSDGRARQGRQPDYMFQAWARYFAKNHGPGYARLTAVLRLAATLIALAHRGLRGRSIDLPRNYLWDFSVKVLLRRLSPPPRSPKALAPLDHPARPARHRGARQSEQTE